MIQPSRKHNAPIDIDGEIKAITRYLEKHWDTSGLTIISGDPSGTPAEQLVATVVNKGRETGHAGIDLSMGVAIGKKMNDRRLHVRLMEGPESKFPESDGYFFLMNNLTLALMNFQTASGRGEVPGVISNLEKSCNASLDDLSSQFKGLDTLKPKGYVEFTENYVEYDGMDTLDQEALGKDFDGHDFSGAGGFPLPEALSLPCIAYDDLDQGRDPLSVLLMRLFHQGVKIREYNNTHELKLELEALGDSSQAFINQKLTPGPDQPNIRRLLNHANQRLDNSYQPMTEEMIQDKDRKNDEFEALSDDEKRARKVKNIESILNALSNVGGPK